MICSLSMDFIKHSFYLLWPRHLHLFIPGYIMVHVVEKVENGLIMASALILQMQKLVFAALILFNAPGAKHPGGILKKVDVIFKVSGKVLISLCVDPRH